MSRWLLWLPLCALTCAVAFFALRAGWQVASLTESDVINRAAQNYVESGEGRALTDCSALPSMIKGVWLNVTCTPANGLAQTYDATRFGAVSLSPDAPKGPDV